jgi:predicted transcriptional regulator
MLTSAKEIIDALGGSRSAADLLGVSPSAPSNWIKRGGIPSRYFVDLRKKLGEAVDPAAFTFTEAQP